MNLHVHLQGGNALAGSSYFKVHVAGKVFCVGDVALEHRALSPSIIRPMAMPTGAFKGTRRRP